MLLELADSRLLVGDNFLEFFKILQASADREVCPRIDSTFLLLSEEDDFCELEETLLLSADLMLSSPLLFPPSHSPMFCLFSGIASSAMLSEETLSVSTLLPLSKLSETFISTSF